VTHAHPTALIVEDHDDVREALVVLLELIGYAAESARSGREALAVIRRVQPCVILLDLMMPDMTGEDFRAAQLADPALRHIPVVVLSASVHVKAAAERMQAAAWVMKPVGMRVIADLVTAHCLK
jgi:CheY-like chemotaxis protein